MPDPRGICVTDLDGTLLTSDRQITDASLAALHELGKRRIMRIIATGRSLYSFSRVLPPDLPIDYIIFSTGAGIMEWRSRQIIHRTNLNAGQISRAMTVLNRMKMDYALHYPIPETHRFFYVQAEKVPDFQRRCEYYAEFASPLTNASAMNLQTATQFLAITEPDRMADVDRLSRMLSPLTVIRTTSPLDFRSLWIEVFATGVNKGNAVLRLAEDLSCPRSRIMVIGNDYNDIDMLRLGVASYVTANAPEDLRQEFHNVSHHDDDAFREAVTDWLDKLDN
ncbi:MAG: HAD family phosphatase [Candidatus Cloacimonetes bacterium]|nr:HAD family phosphatase [Candidatus Cloacimonadota bacterium]